jgi:hypothetical protein
MTGIAIVSLLLLCGWLVIRLGSLRSENINLKARVESLRRQLRAH